MSFRSLLHRGSPTRHARRLHRPLAGRLSTSAPAPKPADDDAVPQAQQSWLTQTVQASPVLRAFFLGIVATALGHASPRHLAHRRALHLYGTLCAPRADEEAPFWIHECALPPTLQSWFAVTNLHVWLLTVRLRALPAPHGVHHIQGLVDHFFQDAEERVRRALQPGALPATHASPYPPTRFYSTPAAAAPAARAPEHVVARQLRILKEQWTGLGLSMDLGLVRGDAELAAAVWRNLLGARGAAGIGRGGGGFRRAVNLVGGTVERVDRLDVDTEEHRDDGSGVYDFGPHERGRYVAFPETMAAVVAYIRREAQRLEGMDDAAVLGPREVGQEGEGVAALRWGRLRPG